MPKKRQTKNGPEYNPITLFQEYVRRIQKNYEDPKLDEIENILRDAGFTIEIGEQGDNLELWQDGRLHIAFVATFLLVDSYGNVCDSTGQIIVKTPVDTKLILTEPDASFLQEVKLKW